MVYKNDSKHTAALKLPSITSLRVDTLNLVRARVQGGAYSRILRNKVFPVFAKPVNDN